MKNETNFNIDSCAKLKKGNLCLSVGFISWQCMGRALTTTWNQVIWNKLITVIPLSCRKDGSGAQDYSHGVHSSIVQVPKYFAPCLLHTILLQIARKLPGIQHCSSRHFHTSIFKLKFSFDLMALSTVKLA